MKTQQELEQELKSSEQKRNTLSHKRWDIENKRSSEISEAYTKIRQEIEAKYHNELKAAIVAQEDADKEIKKIKYELALAKAPNLKYPVGTILEHYVWRGFYSSNQRTPDGKKGVVEICGPE